MEAIEIGWRTGLLFALSGPTLAAAAMIAARGADRRASLWLAALLAAWAWHSIPYVIGFAGAYTAWPWLTFAPFNMELAFGPLLYFHARAIAREGTAPRQAWWLAPWALYALYTTACFVFLGSGESKFAFNDAFHEPYVAPLASLAAVGLGVAGVWRTLQATRTYAAWLTQSHAAADAFDPVWLRRFAVIAVSVAGLFVGFEAWSALVGGLRYVESYWLYVAIGALMLWLGLDGLTRVDTAYPKMRAPAPASGAVRATPLNAEEIAEQIQTKGWQRDPGLSLASLARKLAANESYVSRAINADAGVTFNTFVNQIRVREVQARLAKPDCEDTLLAVALEEGFASKATFNRVFRDLVGMTPSEWRRRARSQRLNPRNFDDPTGYETPGPR